ncbi:two-component response regulator-like APRR9 [Wolffia australiana]
MGEIVDAAREKKEVDGGGTYVEVVKWDALLPKMVLRVLLVEADDSTRKILSALLRKCGFRVSAASDGLEAWEILKEEDNRIDLVLTEVELPNMSGYALLSMIMERESCKSIPVIMMSSRDSMNMVFKCMLKGAVDFLVKPMRKNELRNLWQHVWRRQLPSESPGSACGQKKAENLAFLPSAANSECNSVSNHSTEDMDSSHEQRERSTKGSDTQSSCNRPDTEAESVKMLSVCGQNDLKLIISGDDRRHYASDGDKEGTSDRETLSPREDHGTQHDRNQHHLHNSSGFKRCRVLQAGLHRSQTIDVDESWEFRPQLTPPFSKFESKVDKLNHSCSSAFSWYSAKPLAPTDQLAKNKDQGSDRGSMFLALYEPSGPAQKQTQDDQTSGGGGSVVTSENGALLGPSAQREAALTKFRLKRKDRCFEKKVRYQSRKTLAEQRPRVKGQFVRQVKPGV